MQVNHNKINASLRLGIAIMFVALVAIGLIGFNQLHRLTEARASYKHTVAVLATLDAILETAQDAETGQRGFLLTGQENYLAPHTAAVSYMKELLSKVKELLGNSPEQAKNIDGLETTIKAKFAELAQTIQLRRTKGLAATLVVVMNNTGKHQMDVLRGIIAQMKEEEETLLTIHAAELDKRSQTVFLGLFLISAVAIIFQTIMGLITIKFLKGQKLAEQALRESKERFELLISGVRDYAIFMLDPQGKIMTWNDGARRITGYTADEIISKHFSCFYTEEERTTSKAEHELGLAIQAGRYEEEGQRTRKDGSQFWANVIITPLYDESGKLTGFAKITRDITERKEVERRVSEFYSTVSHELRTPLTSIRGTLSLMDKGRLGELPQRAQNLTKIALSESERLIRLINDILDIRKIEAGKLELRLEELDPSEIINSTFLSLASMAQEFSVRFVRQINTESKICGDHDRIIQVLTNLLSNAIKFSPPDTDVVVDVENVNSDTVRFSVIDKGPGIAADQLPKLFGLFQQLDSSDSRPKGGTGLGLTISKAMVEQHGGKIGVNTSVGQGSTFWFELPIQQQQQKKTVVHKNISARHKVLLVEDDHHLCLVLSEALASEGYVVDEARTLKQATEYLAQDNIMPVIILLDIHLPDGNGLELLQQMRKQVQTSSIPVVIITGSELTKGEYSDPLLIDWIKKPFDIQRLLSAINLAISSRAPGRARVLVVDDDAPTRELIKQQLQSFDIECLEATDGIGAVHLARIHDPDLIILDLAMPHPDGFEVVEILRQEKNQTTPLLVYTARDLTSNDKDKLTLGLSAYLTKSRTSEEQFLNTVKTLLNGLIPGAKTEKEAAASSTPTSIRNG